uniref:SAC domain-containing protein n=1 Tax=Rhizochromulina marina TaxID=1034831 RepID=A0A7S2WKG3_9STRA|mmetsp:Transcript_26196/g.76397  ORF Transcript_26196/g.76397 Transcript_26196/m.76397 type:complete len:499 (+) Transcript_26196:234-1730(+)
MDLLRVPCAESPVNETAARETAKSVELLREALDAHELYFCRDPEHDVTQTLQRRLSMTHSDSSAWKRCDRRFFWNQHVVAPLVQAGADEWVTPVMNAFVRAVPVPLERIDSHAAKNGTVKGSLLLISRRSAERQGTRFLRGVNDQGQVANFVETEQVALVDGGAASAHVQIRGSVPLFWGHPAHLKYRPPLRLDTDQERHRLALEKHISALRQLYGSIVFVNLIDKTKEQGELGKLLRHSLSTLAVRLRAERKSPSEPSPLRHVWFDFHHECKNMQWGNLGRLEELCKPDIKFHSFFSLHPEEQDADRAQRGVLRTNCIDCLDRTNVVQSIFARKLLDEQLADLGLRVPADHFKGFDTTFRGLWSDNADAIAVLYAGTGALKGDFTRRGKRTKLGILRDGVNAVQRYYMNHFVDPERQEGLDLLLFGRREPRETTLRVASSTKAAALRRATSLRAATTLVMASVLLLIQTLVSRAALFDKLQSVATSAMVGGGGGGGG